MERIHLMKSKVLLLAVIFVLSPFYLLGQNTAKEVKEKEYPFIWGAQYYRAPTPEPEVWEEDFQKMQELGFNSVKFWVQWRWSHIDENEYYFDDLKKLLLLAEKYDIEVTLNTIFDVSPIWLYDKYPDAKQVMNSGKIIEPFTAAHRQIGGHPGPCYNHPGALEERKKFLAKSIELLKEYPALKMWDVWNEPELSYPQRHPIEFGKLACYCGNCEAKFKEYLQDKYETISELNNIWGRNYQNWNQVEMPRSGETLLDFVDWREYY